jgi:ATP-binding cassette, subfamily B, bacterial MsbA
MTHPISKTDFQSLTFLFKQFVQRYWAVSLCLLVVSLAAGLAAVLQPLTLAPALNIMDKVQAEPAARLSELSLNNLGPTLVSFLGIQNPGKMQLIVLVSVLYVAFAALTAILNFVAYVLAIWMRTTIGRDLAMRLQRHLLGLPLSYFNRQKTGDLVSRFGQDVNGTAYFIDSVTRGILQSLITILLCLVLLMRTDVMLTVATLVVGSLHILITHALARHVRQNIFEQNRALGGQASVLQEMVQNIRTVKSFAAEKFEEEHFLVESENVRRGTLKYSVIKHFEEPLRLIANAVAIAIVLVLCFRSLERGQLSMPGFAMFLLLAQRIIEPMSQFASHLLALSGMLGCATRLMEIFNIRSILTDGSEVPASMQDRLMLRNVCFHYEAGRPVLEDINLTIRRGEMVAVVGPSGSGKTTLADLILRLYDPQGGAVELDGTDVRRFTQAGYRRLFGVVPQECLLFNATLRDNIVYGRPLDGEKLNRVIKLSGAEDFVTSLPAGVETIVGDRGVRLSGGQRQRIAIARALYGEPEILVLDEATSALDTESERQVQDAIDRVVKQMTAIVIAHRLSTVRHADRIIVLKEGRVEAVGSHEELLSRSPTYEQLCRMQFAA